MWQRCTVQPCFPGLCISSCLHILGQLVLSAILVVICFASYKCSATCLSRELQYHQLPVLSLCSYGITGVSHDSANILVTQCIFHHRQSWYSSYLKKNIRHWSFPNMSTTWPLTQRRLAGHTRHAWLPRIVMFARWSHRFRFIMQFSFGRFVYISKEAYVCCLNKLSWELTQRDAPIGTW